MGKTSKLLIGTALALLLTAVPAMAQWAGGLNPYSQYSGSSLMQNAPQPGVYYPYWHNYLDRLQQEGGYQQIRGNYQNSPAVTSYYPTASDSNATSPQAAQQSSSMYYNPSEYYRSYGNQAPQASPQQTQNQAAYYQQAPPAAQPAPSPRNARTSNKKRRMTAGQRTYKAPEQSYPSRQQILSEQQAFLQLSGRTQQAAYAQPPANAQQAAYGQQPTGRQPIYGQQQAYGQPQPNVAGGQQQYLQQQGQPAQQDPSGLSEDPLVRRAQQKAYERAVARQRAAELAAQQHAAMQELQQAQNLYQTAQVKVEEEKNKQEALQKEFHRKAVAEAYEGLRASQKRYYDLMGVSQESGRPEQGGYAAAPNQPYAQPASVQPGVGQPGAGQPYAPPAGRYGQPGAATPPRTMAPQPVRPSQATPLYTQSQPQQQQSSGGWWSTLKGVFAGPTASTAGRAGASQRGMFDRGSRRMDEY
jgi:hypothetical protein